MKIQSVFLSKAFMLLFSAEFLYQLAIALTMPIVPNFIVSIGMAVAIGGMVAGLNSLASLICRPLSGAIVDYVADKKKLLIVMSLMFMLSAFGCAAAPNLLIICLCRVAQGVAFAIKSVIVIWMVSVIVDPDSIGMGVGWLSLAYVFANILGPALGSQIGLLFDYRLSFLAAGVVFSIAFLIILWLKPQKTVRQNGVWERGISLKNLFFGPAVLYSVVAGLLTVAMGSTAALLLLVAEERGIHGASLYFAVQAIAMLVLRPLFGRISDKKGIGEALGPTLAFSVIALLILIWADSLGMIIVSAMFMAAGPSSAYPILQAECVRGVDEAMVGRASNTFFIGPDIGMGVGPWLGGMVLQFWGSQALFSISLGVVVIAAAIFAVFSKKKQPGTFERIP